MWLIDQLAERHIVDAQCKGVFDGLAGSGQPLQLDDDSQVPAELRAGFRLLKNAGCLPPELEARKQAIELSDLLKTVHEEEPHYLALHKQLTLLELKLRQLGQSTDFLHGDYADKLLNRIKES